MEPIFAVILMRNLPTSASTTGIHYIPVNEFWIDREAEHDERQFFIDHLLVEHRLMAQGMPYDKALPKADQEERKERRRAGDISRLNPSRAKIAGWKRRARAALEEAGERRKRLDC